MLKHRSKEIEIMDDLNISGQIVDQTLKELNTINKYLGGNALSLRAFKKKVKESKTITLADLGCGGGDIMMEMAKWCRKNNIKARFTGIDANPHIIAYAKKNTRAFPEISYLPINIFSHDFASMNFDVIHCCLFTHHFSSEVLIQLFKNFKSQSTIGVIINDLHRHYLAYYSIALLTQCFSKSQMVRNDASVSVARGFTRQELVDILMASGVHSFDLKWKWAFRWLLTF